MALCSVDVVVIEDSELIRDQLCSLLSTVAGITVAGTARGEWEAIELIDRLRPQVVVLDIGLTPGNGLNVLRAVRGTGVPCRVLMLSNMNLQAYRRQCEALGADGFYDKTTEVDALIADITAQRSNAFCATAPTPRGRSQFGVAGDSRH